MPAPTPVELLHADYAQLHHQPPSTLTADQRRSLTFYNGEMESRSAGEIPDSVPRDVANWIRNVFALEAFVRCQGRMPRENRRLPEGAISAVEKQRANSVRAQRRAFIAGRLCTYQVRRLLCVPGFSFHPLEDVWQASCAAYGDFTATHGDAPKFRSTDPSERALAGWAAKMRLAHRAGTLSTDRVEILTGLDFWTWGAPSKQR
ncbi:helicase associated domain-containing protein [Cryobacterium sp. TMT2-10]|uniref:helicase associated domain-containing protein n=1 Tax=Cryobacterium sp. TMT2-10 TaxID=1259244 RepID=UPI00141AF871|nr:helicase associated domain-containing protein [Cryobacterium sp. TMT2-10]